MKLHLQYVSQVVFIIRAISAGLEVKTRTDKLYLRTSPTTESTNNIMTDNTQNIYPRQLFPSFLQFYNTNLDKLCITEPLNCTNFHEQIF